MVDVLGVTLARGGSKGIPKKNIIECGGLPLLAWTVRCAREAIKRQCLDAYIVSTDDDDIMAVAKEYGAEVPFRRPAELAGDSVWSRDALKHAVIEYERLYGRVEHVIELPCIAPLRSVDDVCQAVKLLKSSSADAVTSLTQVYDKHPVRMKRIAEDGTFKDFCSEYPEGEGSRRQDLEPCFIRNGAIYAMTRDCIVEKFSRHGDKCLAYVMPEGRSVNVDTSVDLKLADIMLRERMTHEKNSG